MKQTEEYFLGEEGVILFDEIQYGNHQSQAPAVGHRWQYHFGLPKRSG